MAKKILCVDDDEGLREQYFQVLGSLGYKIELAENGIDFGCKIGETSFDLLIIDINMPELDGIKALKMLFFSKKIPQLRVIVISGALSLAIESQLKQWHVPYLEKPVSFSDLKEQIEAAWAQLPPALNPGFRL